MKKSLLLQLAIIATIQIAFTQQCQLQAEIQNAIKAQSCALSDYLNGYAIRFVDIPTEYIFDSQTNRTVADPLIKVLQEIDRTQINETFLVKVNILNDSAALELESSVKSLEKTLNHLKIIPQKNVSKLLTDKPTKANLDQLGAQVILLSASFEDSDKLMYFKSPEVLKKDTSLADSTILANPMALNLNHLDNKVNDTCYYVNRTLKNGFSYVYGTEVDLPKLHQAFRCGITVILTHNLIIPDIYTGGFLFLMPGNSLANLSTGCFYLTSYQKAIDNSSQLLLNLNSDCKFKNQTPAVLCREERSQNLFFGKKLPTIGDLPRGKACAQGVLTSPNNPEDVIQVAGLFAAQSSDSLWISLNVDSINGGIPTWDYFRMIVDIEHGTNLTEILAIVSVVVLIGVSLAVILIRARYKKKYDTFDSQQNQNKRKSQDQSKEVANQSPDKKPGKSSASKGEKKVPSAGDGPRELRINNSLIFEEPGVTIIEHDNLMTNLHNQSPKSARDNSSVQATPKNVDFNVEFSIMDADAKSKTDRFIIPQRRFKDDNDDD